MQGYFYKTLVLLTKWFGPIAFMVMARFIAAGYFILFPKRVGIGIHFYKALYPERGIGYHLLCTWKQFQNFTHVYLDRIYLDQRQNVTFISKGWEKITHAIETGQGGLLLMSHMGNWEAAAHLLKKRDPRIRFLLYMGRRQKEEIEKRQKEDLIKKDIKILAVDHDQTSPFDLIEGLDMIKNGGLVSMTGDRLWGKRQRTVSVTFLNHKVLLPEIPYVFALLSGAPLFFFFAFRLRQNHYYIEASDPVYIRPDSRKDRPLAVRNAAQAYAHALEKMLRRYPFEWFHFEPFLLTQ